MFILLAGSLFNLKCLPATIVRPLLGRLDLTVSIYLIRVTVRSIASALSKLSFLFFIRSFVVERPSPLLEAVYRKQRKEAGRDDGFIARKTVAVGILPKPNRTEQKYDSSDEMKPSNC